jgi:hypothetical protein
MAEGEVLRREAFGDLRGDHGLDPAQRADEQVDRHELPPGRR